MFCKPTNQCNYYNTLVLFVKQNFPVSPTFLKIFAFGLIYRHLSATGRFRLGITR